mmetsp:Transcript_1069/g.2035  ORF Transcript_1069/g.2035 Transcript_1069/m.2035 type:complete len:244 (-) Transcript_1069:534-1265(-)
MTPSLYSEVGIHGGDGGGGAIVEEGDMFHENDIERFLLELQGAGPCPMMDSPSVIASSDGGSPPMELSQVQTTADDDSSSTMHAVGLSSPFELFGGEVSRKDDRSAPSAMRNRSYMYGLTPERKENKAAREKLRRNELNEKFVTLGNMLGVKSDKVSILNQSMFCIQSLRRENEQIKSDNIKMKAENTALLGLLRRVLPTSVGGKDIAAIAHVLPSLLTPTEYQQAFGSLEDDVSAVLHPPVA